MRHNAPAAIQQSVPGSRDGRSGRARPVRLVQSQQLRQSTVQIDSSRSGHNRGTSSRSDSDSAALAGATMDGETQAHEHRSAGATTASGAGMCPGASGVRNDRTASKSGVEPVRLADLWRTRLSSRGWSQTASELLTLCLADSTQLTYNRYIQDCQEFCATRDALFPPDDSAILADFLLDRCKSSERPHSTLRCISAALGAVYEGCGMNNLMSEPHISRLCQAIVKCGTEAPMQRSRVMDVSAFTRMFRSWQCNDALSLKQLRIKTITLLAIVLMLRPSDIAPKATSFDISAGIASRFTMSTMCRRVTTTGDTGDRSPVTFWLLRTIQVVSGDRTPCGPQ